MTGVVRSLSRACHGAMRQLNSRHITARHAPVRDSWLPATRPPGPLTAPAGPAA